MSSSSNLKIQVLHLIETSLDYYGMDGRHALIHETECVQDYGA